MTDYELVVLFHPDLELDIDTPIAKTEKLITNAGGKLIKRDNWGKKRLAYKINKHSFAVYVYFEFSMDPEKVRQLDEAVRINEEIIRHLIVKHVEPTVTEETEEAAEESTPAKQPATKAAAAATEDK